MRISDWSSDVCSSDLLTAERVAAAFAKAGLPEGVFQPLHLSHDMTARLVAEDTVDFVAFTGSVAGGLAVQQALAGRFAGCGLELGGKDPAYVRADADLTPAVADRKSVVEGKSVSVRVDLGGRGFIKKKKK